MFGVKAVSWEQVHERLGGDEKAGGPGERTVC